MTPQELIEFLKGRQQDHILEHCRSLSPQKREDFFRELTRLDLPLVFELHGKFSGKKDFPSFLSHLEPAPIIPVPQTPEEKARWKEAYQLGESLIRQNRVAVLIVAGGQGTRLGFDGPKGKFPISPVRNKTLFQIFAESLRALRLRYRASIPLLIMTSEENHSETREFFEIHRFFGLEPEDVHFFNQEMLPTLTPEGKLILKDADHLHVNPDGHGGSLPIGSPSVPDGAGVLRPFLLPGR